MSSSLIPIKAVGISLDDLTLFSSLVGSLQSYCLTRLYIVFVVNKLC